MTIVYLLADDAPRKLLYAGGNTGVYSMPFSASELLGVKAVPEWSHTAICDGRHRRVARQSFATIKSLGSRCCLVRGEEQPESAGSPLSSREGGETTMKPVFGIAHPGSMWRLIPRMAPTLAVTALALLGSERLSTAATTLIVNNAHPSASNSNPGTEALPLLTIQAAANRATPGTTIHVREGVYNEMVSVSKHGHRGAMISFVVDGDDHVVIDSPSYACFNLAGASYIKIHGFEMTGAYGGEGTEVAHGGGIRAYPKNENGYGAKECVFANNVIHDNDAGIWVVLSHKNYITNNVIFNSNEASIRIKRGDYNRIKNNLTFNNGLGEAWGITFYGSVGTKVVHNTVYEPTGGGVYIYEGTSNLNGALPGTPGFCVPSEGSVVKNNILVVGGAGSGNSAPLVIGSSTTTDRAPKLDQIYGPINNEYTHNLFFNQGEPELVVSWGDFNEQSTFPYYGMLCLAELQAKSPGYGASSIAGDPMFVDPEDGDFPLAPGSPAQGTGVGGRDMGADLSKLPSFDPAGSSDAGR
ncbi:MAG: right-handed parallel beta-helix repeat-containing protein [Acidobacteria bacterium]|nr:right-handed parallel beta-helix repeat-containing protein [Acidobacteriota bacterium]